MVDTLKFIKEYLDKQTKLINTLLPQLDKSINEYTLLRNVPAKITLEGVDWKLMAHGAGVMFKNTNTGEEIDVHVGLFDAPNAFDAWRLIQHYESISGNEEDLDLWKNQLAYLANQGLIKPHNTRSNHYVLS